MTPKTKKLVSAEIALDLFAKGLLIIKREDVYAKPTRVSFDSEPGIEFMMLTTSAFDAVAFSQATIDSGVLDETTSPGDLVELLPDSGK